MRVRYDYKMRLTCGCERWYPVTIHPFHGALLHCSAHGLVHSEGEPVDEREAVAGSGLEEPCDQRELATL